MRRHKRSTRFSTFCPLHCFFCLFSSASCSCNALPACAMLDSPALHTLHVAFTVDVCVCMYYVVITSHKSRDTQWWCIIPVWFFQCPIVYITFCLNLKMNTLTLNDHFGWFLLILSELSVVGIKVFTGVAQVCICGWTLDNVPLDFSGFNLIVFKCVISLSLIFAQISLIECVRLLYRFSDIEFTMRGHCAQSVISSKCYCKIKFSGSRIFWLSPGM